MNQGEDAGNLPNRFIRGMVMALQLLGPIGRVRGPSFTAPGPENPHKSTARRNHISDEDSLDFWYASGRHHDGVVGDGAGMGEGHFYCVSGYF